MVFLVPKLDFNFQKKRTDLCKNSSFAGESKLVGNLNDIERFNVLYQELAKLSKNEFRNKTNYFQSSYIY